MAERLQPEDDTKSKAPDTGAIIFRSVLGWAVAVLTGGAGLLCVKFFDLPNMPAAQITIGLFGLAGGFSHTRLIQSAGGKVSRRQVLFLSIVWALSCVGGVTPNG